MGGIRCGVLWVNEVVSSLEISDEALDPPELEGLLGSVAVELKASMQVSVPEMIHKRPDDGLHEVLLHHQHPGLKHTRRDDFIMTYEI